MEKRQVYMDYSATTPVKREVVDAMLPYLTEFYGNPSSLYGPGFAAHDAMEKARAQVAHLLHAEPSQIHFTSSGTEADDWALKGVAEKYAAKGKHIITSAIEHHAILNTAEWLEKNGYEVTYLGVDSGGRISLKELEEAIRPDTILVSVMMANNEIGTIEPIAEACRIAHQHGVLFHTDAVQALGNISIDVKALDVDFLSVSAHKIYAPKGCGALYAKDWKTLPPFIHGGGQEGKLRAGTENVAGIVGFGKAAELAEQNLPEHAKRLKELRDYFVQEVQKRLPYTEVNGTMKDRLPGNVNMIFSFVEGENIMGRLDMAGIWVSTGSACNSSSFAPSHVLAALGRSPEQMYSSIRFSIGDFTTKEDIDYAVEQLTRIVEELRAISPFGPGRGMDEAQAQREQNKIRR